KLATEFDFVREIRGEGLMVGIELTREGGPFVAEALNRGLIINCTHDFTLRLLPPFVITSAQVREFLRLLEQVFRAVPQSTATAISQAPTPAHAAQAAAGSQAAHAQALAPRK